LLKKSFLIEKSRLLSFPVLLSMNDRFVLGIEKTSISRVRRIAVAASPTDIGIQTLSEKNIYINYFALPFDGSFFACFSFFCLYRVRAWYESLACLFHFVHQNLYSHAESDEYLFYQSFFCPRQI